MKFQATRGTKDILPDETKYWRWLEITAHDTFCQYGYRQVITPVFEQTELFTRSIGPSTEIVMKEMYTFKDKGRRSLTLRPEGTVPVIRAYLEAGLFNNQLTKLYYFGPMFRQERPQSGRYREFYQIGVEAIGCEQPMLDSELIMMAAHFLKKLGLKNFEVLVSSVGCPICRPVLRERLKAFFAPLVNNLCEDCQKRYKRNVLRILDCKNEKCSRFLNGLPSILETLCQPCRDHFNLVCEYLDKVSLPFKVSSYLVRGLDYYTRTTFEIISASLGAQNSICGGGRYDFLVKELGGPDTPAVGFAIGVERLVSVLKGEGMSPPQNQQPLFYLIGLGFEAQQKVFVLANYFREKGKRVEVCCDEKSLKSSLRQGHKLGADYVLIIGEEELKSNQVTVRSMAESYQQAVPIEQINEWVMSR